LKENRLIISILLICNCNFVAAQQQLNQFWFGYINQVKLTKKWNLITDFHLRTKDNFTDSFSNSIARIGLQYHLKKIRISSGYAYAIAFPDDNHQFIAQPEHRPWQLVTYTQHIGSLQATLGFRAEERFRHNILNHYELAPGYSFNWRLRYNIALQLPIAFYNNAHPKFSLFTNTEIMYNYGKKFTQHKFDQLRLIGGVAYNMPNENNLQLSYFNSIQKNNAGIRTKKIDAIRIYFFHNLKFSQK
jgi:hypothetical protein